MGKIEKIGRTRLKRLIKGRLYQSIQSIKNNTRMKVFTTIILSFIVTTVYGQFDNTIFNNYKQIDKNDSLKLWFSLDNQNFFHNNEYFNNLYDGYTYLGYTFTPKLAFQPSPKIKLQAGWFFIKYSGRDKFWHSVPWLNCQYKFSKNIDLFLGNIHGTIEHKLIEPLYSFDKHITNNPEEGIQFLGDFKHFEGDLWLNWEKFIVPQDTFQEEFTFAATTKIKLYNPESKFRFSIPLQGMVTHKGGQGGSNSSYLQTYFNTASGFEIEYQPSLNSKYSFGTKNYFLTYNDASDSAFQYYSKGYGVYCSLFATFGKFNFMTGYWYSEHFIAPHGEFLFQSVSNKYTIWWEPNKQLITAKLQFNHKINDGIKLAVRAETYYDLIRYNFDFSYSLFLIINQDFFLKKINI